MGVIGQAIDDIVKRISALVSTFIIYSIIVFILGEFYGIWAYGKGEWIYYPLYVLLLALIIRILRR